MANDAPMTKYSSLRNSLLTGMSVDDRIGFVPELMAVL